MKIRIVTETFEDTNFFTFSGGEVHIQLPELEKIKPPCIITARITNSDKLMELLMITDAIKRNYDINDIVLILPYLPYARQDKISAFGESLSLKVFADIINEQNYSKVITYDVHSDVSNALFNNFKNVQQHNVISYAINSNLAIAQFLKNKIVIIPDHGASKKSYKLKNILNVPKFVQCDKARDQNGNIIRTEVYANVDELYGEDVVIIDDICDGSRTFTEIAKVLKNNFNVNSVTLFTTHGIFSKGTEICYQNGIDVLVTTDTFRCEQHYINMDANIHVAKIVDNLF